MPSVNTSKLMSIIYILGQEKYIYSGILNTGILFFGRKNGTKTINQVVKRHLNKFSERYVFQLTKDEYLNLKSQVGTSSIQNQYGAMITFRT